MSRSPRTARARALLAAVLLTLTATSCSGNGDAQEKQNPPSAASNAATTAAAEAALQKQKPDWKPCPPPSRSEDAGTAGRPPGPDWECATLRAPLDYAHPDGEKIGIAMIRAKATDQSHRIGSLLFNFGGPGGSGVTTLPAFADDYRTLRTRYDLVSFDPRGVGRSSGVTCLPDKELDAYYAADATPATTDEQNALVDRVKKYAEGCQKRSGKVLPHIGTTNAARDLDLMRQVLGDDKLHYFGVSYGTELGGVYAHLFPKNVGRALMDGVVDPSSDPLQSALAQAAGFQLALGDYMAACTKTSDNCPTEQQISSLLDRLEKKPVPGGGGRDLTQSLATGGIAQSLYSKQFWDYLTEGVEDAENGDGKILLMLGDSMNGRGQDGTYSSLQASLNAITCADFAQRYTAADIRRRAAEFRKASPVFGDFMGWSLLQCTGWPVKGEWQTPDVSAKGSAPILVVGNTGDPATPYEGARKMAQELGKGVGVEMTYRGEGHGAYDSGNACVKSAVDAYLLEGTVPAPGKVCS
ncbi:alpha/beta hydrolase [Streptomyces hesseae]|uniref:Alpha/beta hydrolase n=1 Tax=Streptomyces hesseae TaxID=3075519 RepID=A0ABU2SYD1_9ACTN|nr:alpha/beta hydrolase [Streptomyces sp. DSM 40473]MDT0453364.1 alpha/beta hydrolase [Streptomyces sp. DSM 40473]